MRAHGPQADKNGGGEREGARQTDGDRKMETERWRERERERGREGGRETERQRQTDRETERQTDSASSHNEHPPSLVRHSHFLRLVLHSDLLPYFLA